MSQLFRRAVRLTAENVDRNETTTIEKLQVEFDIVRTLEEEPSTLRAVVFNLSEETRSKLEAPDRIIVNLDAGYGDELHNLFLGALQVVRHTRDGADIATVLEAADGARAAKQWARKHFAANTSVRTVFEFLIARMEIGEGNLNEGIDIEETNGLPDEFRAGKHVRGYALKQMGRLCKSRGIDFSIQNGEAQFLTPHGTKPGSPITVAGSDTGLLGSPTIDNDGVMSCKTLLLPHIFPGAQIDVKSEFVDGSFKILRADYTGSVYGSDYAIDIEGKEIE